MLMKLIMFIPWAQKGMGILHFAWPGDPLTKSVHGPKVASWQALSATLPPHILKVVDEKLSLVSSHHLIQLSIN